MLKRILVNIASIAVILAAIAGALVIGLWVLIAAFVLFFIFGVAYLLNHTFTVTRTDNTTQSYSRKRGFHDK